MTNGEVIFPTLLALLGGLLLWLPEEAPLTTMTFVKRFRRSAGIRRDTTRVHARLTQLGRENGYELFRSRQLAIALGSGLLGMFLTFIFTSSTLFSLIVSLLSAIGSYIYIDRNLTKDVKRRLNTIESEFAPVVEMLTLALSAGETPIGSMNRIAERSAGLLAAEFGRVVKEVREGAPFSAALDEMGARSESVMIRRFVDALITAMNRGAPLVDVLQRHALEARSYQRNTLLSIASKAEISMMIPVVFLILPISVLFALWPSVTNLNLFAG